MPGTVQVRVPESVRDTAEEVQDEYGYATIGEAIRHMAREGGYDV
jgi:antitoxin component of RelBE/YafQ-DinJ toxin-antitoxin module